MAWHLEGTYIENCNCDVVCPCPASGFSAPADYERCTVMLAWHIDSGEVDGTDVSDRSVVLLLDSPRQMSEGNWRVGMFMDERASDEQAESVAALTSRPKVMMRFMCFAPLSRPSAGPTPRRAHPASSSNSG